MYHRIIAPLQCDAHRKATVERWDQAAAAAAAAAASRIVGVSLAYRWANGAGPACVCVILFLLSYGVRRASGGEEWTKYLKLVWILIYFGVN